MHKKVFIKTNQENQKVSKIIQECWLKMTLKIMTTMKYLQDLVNITILNKAPPLKWEKCLKDYSSSVLLLKGLTITSIKWKIPPMLAQALITYQLMYRIKWEALMLLLSLLQTKDSLKRKHLKFLVLVAIKIKHWLNKFRRRHGVNKVFSVLLRRGSSKPNHCKPQDLANINLKNVLTC